jgi:hypothetical protein
MKDIMTSRLEHFVDQYNEDRDVKITISDFADLTITGLDGYGFNVLGIKNGKTKFVPVVGTRKQLETKSIFQRLDFMESQLKNAIAELDELLAAEAEQEKQ